MEVEAILVCLSLLESRRIAESEGRLDFSAIVEAGPEQASELTARVDMGPPYSVGRITFSGHHTVNDSTLRRAMTLRERDLFDVGKLRNSLSRINRLGIFEPLTLADLTITRWKDGATADVTIPLRERRRRSWLLSGPLIPGMGWLQASVASRLPPWGRGIFEASTYVVRLNLLGFVTPFAKVFPLVLERPPLPGQEWLSGFAVSPGLSPQQMLAYYGRAQLTRGAHAVLAPEMEEPLVISVPSSGEPAERALVCTPPRPRLWWLRRGVLQAIDLTLGAVLP